jgi:vanillate O-demethylase ferredoxin subunit
VEGNPEHRDVFLTDKEKAQGKLIMPCCSRAKTGSITLDL